MGPPIEDNSKLPVVDWKSFTLSTIQALREWTELQITALRKWVKVHIRLRDRAVKISIKELERRLEELNNAAARRQEQERIDRESFVQRPVFEGLAAQVLDLKERMDQWSGERQGASGQRVEARASRQDVSPLLLSVIGIVGAALGGLAVALIMLALKR